MTQKVPITGFLGVGKTTIMKNLLKNAEGKRIAILVNEFGDVGMDGEIIETECNCEEGGMIELANGCICCTVQEEFLPAMQELVERKNEIDHIVIETSGLAMPKPLVRAVNWPDLKPHITVDSVITVVDAAGVATGEICDREKVQAQREADENLDHETPIEELFYDQLTCADLVLLSKKDLVTQEQYDEILSILNKRVNNNTKVLPVSHGDVPVDVLLGVGASAEDDLESRHSIHEAHHENEEEHEHDDSIQSVSITLDQDPTNKKVIVDSLKKLVDKHEIYRIKGYVNIPDKPMRLLVQGVGERFETYFDKKWEENEERKTNLVIIGRYIENLELSKEIVEEFQNLAEV
ncbi:MAG: cobalamin biosynthesis protein CobW [Flavobacteriales bacterium]